MLSRQVPQNQSGAPVETWGLDLFSTVSSWASSNPSATPDQWRNKISDTEAGPGYTAFPDELLSNLYIGYVTPPFVNASGQTVTGLDDYHDATLIQKIVNAIDSVTYMQCSDGGLPQQGQDWPGLTSTARATGQYAGLTGRQPTQHGGGDLQGCDTYTLGYVIIGLLDDPTAAPIFESYLTQNYDADLDGSSYERATAYERLLSNAVNFYTTHTGGVESQNSFQMIALYAMQVALEKLQILYPNSAYPALAPETGLSYAEMVLGLYPDILRGVEPPAGINYGLTPAGLGEAHGQMSSGYDGRYGSILPWLLPRLYLLAEQDPGLTSADQETISDMLTMSHGTLDSYDHFLSVLDNPTVGVNDMVITDHSTIAQEDFITYRNTYNPNADADGFLAMSSYESSDPNQGIDDAYALRSAYLETQYGVTPITGSGGGYSAGGQLQYLKDLPFYELTIRNLIGVSPASLTPLPGEPGQPDFTWCNVTNGATAFTHNGERFYMNANWRNYETNNNSFGLVSNIARIHDTTSAVDYAAQIYMPHDGTTAQSDANLSGSLENGWVVRYGQYLIAGNNSSLPLPVQLPNGSGTVKELHHNLNYSLGTTVTLPVGDYAIFVLPPAGYAAPNLVAPTILNAQVGNARAVLSWTGVNGAESYNIERSTTSGGPYSTIATGVLSPCYNDLTLANGVTYYYVVAAVNSAGAVGPLSPQATVTTVTTSLPVPWTDSDVGATGLAGSASYSNGVFTVNGAGNDIWSSSSQFHYAYTPIIGPFTATVEVLTEQDTNAWTKAGLLATQSLNPEDVFNDIVVTPGNGIVDQQRTSFDGGPSQPGSLTGLKAPYWVRMVRNGPTLTTYAAPDGVTWTEVGTTSISMSDPIYIGLCDCAHTSTPTLNASTFANFTITGNATYAPNTSVSLSGTMGENNWYRSGVTATLSAQASGDGLGNTYYTLDGSAQQTYRNPISISGDGYHILNYWSVSAAGDIEAVKSTLVQIDSTPSVSTGSSTGSLVTLSETDNVSEAQIFYSVDGGATQAYAAPFNVSPTGAHTVSYYSADEAGNQESPHTLSLMSAPPVTTATLTGALNGSTYASDVVVSLSASGSNPISKTYYSIDGYAPVAYTTPFTVSGWGSHSFSYWSVDSAGNTEAQNTQTVTIEISSSVPAPWQDLDIGYVALQGSANYSGGSFLLQGSGLDIWGTYDAFHFAYLTLSGNFTISARVASETNTSNWAKYGVMVRQSLAPGSGFVDMLITPGNGAAFMHRSATGALAWSNSSSTVAAPQYVKLVRSGSTFTGYYSPNGTTWTQEGSFTYAMTDPVVVGLAAGANNSSAIGTAQFDHVVISTSDTTPPVTTATVSGKSGNNGWYVSPVQVTLSATDAGSTVFGTYYTIDGGAQQTYSAPFTIFANGVHTITCWSVDDLDNVETAHSLTIDIDATPPTMTFGAITPAPNAAGWNNSAVTIPFTAADATSGVATATPGSPLTFSGEGTNQTQTVTVTDVAGNSATSTSPSVSIDLTAPATTSYVSGATITLSATDNLSGVAWTYYTVDRVRSRRTVRHSRSLLRVRIPSPTGRLTTPGTSSRRTRSARPLQARQHPHRLPEQPEMRAGSRLR